MIDRRNEVENKKKGFWTITHIITKAWRCEDNFTWVNISRLANTNKWEKHGKILEKRVKSEHSYRKARCFWWGNLASRVSPGLKPRKARVFRHTPSCGSDLTPAQSGRTSPTRRGLIKSTKSKQFRKRSPTPATLTLGRKHQVRQKQKIVWPGHPCNTPPLL